MNKSILVLLSLIVVGLSTAIPAIAQPGAGMGRGRMPDYRRPFDINTVVTVTGEIAGVVYVEGKFDTSLSGVHLVLKTDGETIPVHLGPVWYIEKQETFKYGDRVTVTGSRVTFNNAPALVASVVIRGEMRLQLRDQNGYPAWRGWRRLRTRAKVN